MSQKSKQLPCIAARLANNPRKKADIYRELDIAPRTWYAWRDGEYAIPKNKRMAFLQATDCSFAPPWDWDTYERELAERWNRVAANDNRAPAENAITAKESAPDAPQADSAPEAPIASDEPPTGENQGSVSEGGSFDWLFGGNGG